MTTEVRGVHFEIDERIREYIDRKVARLEFARELVVELPITITKGTREGFDLETTVHFRWGKSTHIGVKSYDVHKGVDALFDKLEEKITREKAKIQHHKGDATVRTGEGAAEPSASSAE
jgi:putative sigma-54 modulation protein